MKEADYINATNLAKLRIAKEVLRDVLTTNPAEEKKIADYVSSIALWCIELQDRLK